MKSTSFVHFAVGSSVLTPKARKELSEMANDVGSVEGYLTEGKGTPTLQDCRGESGFQYRRAHSVFAFLDETADIPLARLLHPGAKGETRPAAPSGRRPRPGGERARRDRNSGKRRCIRIVKF